jgi:hypothetical protein
MLPVEFLGMFGEQQKDAGTQVLPLSRCSLPIVFVSKSLAAGLGGMPMKQALVSNPVPSWHWTKFGSRSTVSKDPMGLTGRMEWALRWVRAT